MVSIHNARRRSGPRQQRHGTGIFQYMTAREGVWFAAGSQLYDFCKNNKE